MQDTNDAVENVQVNDAPANESVRESTDSNADKNHSTTSDSNDSQVDHSDDSDIHAKYKYLENELSKVRKESAKYRTEKRDINSALSAITAEHDELKKQYEEVLAERDSLSKLIDSARKDAICAEFGVPSHLLPDGSEEEMRKRAEELVSWSGKSNKAPIVQSVAKNDGSNAGYTDSDVARMLLTKHSYFQGK